MTLALRPYPGGTLLPVRVRPASRRQGLAGPHAGSLRVAVSAAPERGKANDAVRELLAAALGLRSSRVELIRGATAREKVFLIQDMSADELRGRVEAALAAAGTESCEDA
ncbi:MAG: DUF167 domain-containing protein [Planctomycetota bacterium]|nr:DUF167 domain-containing protein [Planctomycetota bacterium]